MDESQIRQVVRDVIQEVAGGRVGQAVASRPPAAAQVAAAPAVIASSGPAPAPSGGAGVFGSVDDAITAARKAFRDLSSVTVEQRGQFIQALRDMTLQHAEEFSRLTRDETGMGRYEHKVIKHHSVAKLSPGIEMLTTNAWSGDHGLTIEEMAPWGVIGAITPSTHPVPTMLNNAICFIASGNVAVFNAHPAGQAVFRRAVDLANRAMMAVGAPENCVTCVAEPTIESAQTVFTHPDINLLLITGGPGVVAEAMKAPKRAICAGPGNPPVVVDETADLANAAKSIVTGGAFDNNILCIGEKQVFCVDSVFDRLKTDLLKNDCVELDRSQIAALAKNAFGVGDMNNCAGARLNREFVGRDASVLAESVGLRVPDSTMLLIGETEYGNVFVQEEQMTPFIPLVRCRDAYEGIDMALDSEHGFRHTSLIHSTNITVMSDMARRVNTTIFVKNGASTAGDGLGGEGYMSFSIATPTGEGITTPATFTRKRRCTLVDAFRII